MAGMTRKNKAVILSLVIHGILFVSTGFCLWRTSEPPQQEVIEIALADSTEVSEAKGNDKVAAQKSVNANSHKNSVVAKKKVSISDVAENQQQEEDYAESLDTMESGEADSLNNGSEKGYSAEGNGAGTGSGEGNGNASGDGAGGQISPPAILSRPEPQYPRTARQKGIEGTVYLRVQILTNGSVGGATVTQSSGDDSLDEAAVKSTRKWKFIPAKNLKTGKVIACYTQIPVKFDLN